MQFKPPSQPGWGQSEPEEPVQQPFPGWQQQPSMDMPIPPVYDQSATSHLPQQPMMPAPPPRKRLDSKAALWISVSLLIGIILIFVVIGTGVFAGASTAPALSQTDQDATATAQSADVAATTVAIQNSGSTGATVTLPTDTPTPAPTVSAAEVESIYKASTTDTTIPTLDKDGNADSGKDVHFTARLLNFVKDSSGNTAGANLDDPTAATGVVQIAFPPNTDLSQLNVDDTLEVWATDNGTSSGQNAFGATVQEVVLSANYLTDKTTGYQTH